MSDMHFEHGCLYKITNDKNKDFELSEYLSPTHNSQAHWFYNYDIQYHIVWEFEGVKFEKASSEEEFAYRMEN